MRDLSTNVLNQIASKTGNRPINIIEISWIDGTSIKYADQDLPGIQGKILQLDKIDNIANIRSGSSASVNVILDDTDESIRNLMSTNDIHRRPATIYQYYDGMALTDAFVLLKGMISSPISWKESDRTLSFTIMTLIETFQVGFAPEEGQFQFIPADLTGTAWPLCFGSPIHVPAVKAARTTFGLAMSYFGFPDPSLTLKQQLIQFKLNNYNDGYNYYVSLLDKAAQYIDDPYDIQQRYVDNIIHQDSVAQQKEDACDVVAYLNAQLVTISNQYKDEADVKKRNSLKDSYKTLKQNKLFYIGFIKGLTTQWNALEDKKKEARLETKQGRFVYTLQGRIRNKIELLYKHYLQAQEDFDKLTEAIQNQRSLMAAAVAVQYGEQFPQNQDLLLNVLGLRMLGRFNGNILELGPPVSTYYNVPIIPDPKAYDTFAVDPDINLNNHYCKMDNGAIIKITSHNGFEAKFELIKRKDVTTFQHFALEENVLNEVRQNLGRYLTGSETDQELLSIVNGFPTDIAAPLWKQLQGGQGQLTLFIATWDGPSNNFVYNANGGTFRLKVGDDITGTLGYDATGKDIIAQFSNFVNIPPDSVTVDKPSKAISDGPLTFTFAVPITNIQAMDVTGLVGDQSKLTDLEPVGENLAGQKPKPIIRLPSIYFDVVDTKPSTNTLSVTYDKKVKSAPVLSAYFWLIYNGQKTESFRVCDFKKDPLATGLFPYKEISADEIKNALEALPVIQDLETFGTLQPVKGGEASTDIVTVTGGPLPKKPIQIKIDADSKCVFVEMDYLVDTDPKTGKETPLSVGTVNCSFDLGHAQQFTNKKRKQIIKNNVQRTGSRKNFDTYKKRLNGLWAELNSDDITEDQRTELKNMFSADLKSYTKVLGDLNLTLDDTSDAFKLISNHEQGALYDLEVLGFLLWQRSQFPPKIDVTDNRQEYYFTATDFKAIAEASPVILQSWLTGYVGKTDINGDINPDTVKDITGVLKVTSSSNKKAKQTRDIKEIIVENIRSIPSAKPFYCQIGTQIQLAANFQEKYIANLVPSTIHAVYGYRVIGGLRQLVPVPSSFYVKNEADNYGLFTATSITLVRPLKEYQSQNWEDKLYVTLSSSIGQNTADIIQWIVEHFTNLSIDPTAFATAQAQLTNYPMNFALLQKQDALSVIQDIAFQARCDLWLKDETVQIMYLPAEPTPVDTLTESDIKDLQFGFTDTDSLVTKFVASWRTDYAQPKDDKVVLRYNMAKYGELEQDYSFHCYNLNDVVLHAATFWLIRHSNTWKRAIFNTFPHKLNLEVNDWITLNLTDNPFASAPVPALIQKADFDTANGLISMECWIPVRAGEMAPYTFAFPAGLSVDFEFPEVQAIATGNAGSPGNLVPTGVNYDPGDPTLFRPRDFGEFKPTDIKDTFPINPALALGEIDYIPDLTVEEVAIVDAIDPTLDETVAAAHGDPEPHPAAVTQSTAQLGNDCYSTLGTILYPVNTSGTNANGQRSITQPQQVAASLQDDTNISMVANEYWYMVELMDGRQVEAKVYDPGFDPTNWPRQTTDTDGNTVNWQGLPATFPVAVYKGSDGPNDFHIHISTRQPVHNLTPALAETDEDEDSQWWSSNA